MSSVVSPYTLTADNPHSTLPGYDFITTCWYLDRCWNHCSQPMGPLTSWWMCVRDHFSPTMGPWVKGPFLTSPEKCAAPKGHRYPFTALSFRCHWTVLSSGRTRRPTVCTPGSLCTKSLETLATWVVTGTSVFFEHVGCFFLCYVLFCEECLK